MTRGPGHDECARALLAVGGDANSHTEDGNCIAASAAAQGHWKVVLLLAKAGANLEFTHKDSGYTPLMMAAVGGNVKCVRVLLDHGADVMAVDNVGRTAKVV